MEKSEQNIEELEATRRVSPKVTERLFRLVEAAARGMEWRELKPGEKARVRELSGGLFYLDQPARGEVRRWGLTLQGEEALPEIRRKAAARRAIKRAAAGLAFEE